MVELPARIENKILPEPNSGCWLWLGAVNEDGYGRVGVRDGELWRNAHAHRHVYELLVGPIAAGKHLLHRCDNPCCVNPDHLFQGTPKTNKEDSVAKGRHVHGERHPASKLTDETALQILHASGKYRDIAKKFGVHHSIVGGIKSRKHWKHLEDIR
jgi:hypothetical protein